MNSLRQVPILRMPVPIRAVPLGLLCSIFLLGCGPSPTETHSAQAGRSPSAEVQTMNTPVGVRPTVAIPDASPVPSEQPRGPWIASWKGVQVRESVFIRQYVRYVATLPVSDDLQTRRDFTLELLKREVIAHHAQRLHLDGSPEIRRQVEIQQQIEMARQYVRQQVVPRVPTPSEQQVRDAFRRRNTRVELQQIYATSRPQIDSLYALLMAGAQFETLAKRSMRAAGQPQEGWEMGWVRWNQMGLQAEEAAFDLQEGDVSRPVASLNGWHIFRATDREEAVFADASTYRNAREGLEAALTRRYIEEEASRFVDSSRIAAGDPPVLYMRRIRELTRRIQLSGAFRDPRSLPQANALAEVVFEEPGAVRPSGPPDGSHSETLLTTDTPIAEWNGVQLTGGDFIAWMVTYPSALTLETPAQVVESILTDLHFARLADRAGFHSHPEVVLTTHLARTQALNLALREIVADTLDHSRIADRWEARWMSDFVTDIHAQARWIAFRDSLEALNWVQSARSTADRVAATTIDSTLTLSLKTPEQEEREIAALLLASPGDDGWLGPVLRQGRWIAIQAVRKDTTFLPAEQRTQRTLERLSQQAKVVAGEEILREIGFLSQNVRFNERAIRAALPLY